MNGNIPTLGFYADNAQTTLNTVNELIGALITANKLIERLSGQKVEVELTFNGANQQAGIANTVHFGL